MLNVFLAIAVDNLADADALGESDAKETPEVEVTYEVNDRNDVRLAILWVIFLIR